MTYPTHPTYEQIQEGCLAFSKTYEAPEVIIGLARGGLINAVILSHIYGDTKMLCADYSSAKGKGENAGYHAQEVPAAPPGSRILLVDDICDSGHTMKELVKRYESRGHIVDCYVSFWKESSVWSQVDYTWKIPEDSPWIIFPWETE